MRTFNIGKWQETIRRRTAAFLTVVMMVQTPLSAWAAVEPYAEGSSNSKTFDMTGEPADVFSSLKLAIYETISKNENAVHMRVDAVLDDAALQDIFGTLIDDGKLMDEADWEDEPGDWNSYDEYLNDQGDLPEITFTSPRIMIHNDALDPMLLPSGAITTDDNEVIGSWEIVMFEGGSFQIQGKLFGQVYNRSEVTFGQEINAVLEKTYAEDTEITVGGGAGDADITVTIPENAGNTPGDPNYGIEKTVEKTENNHLIYTITATASDASEVAVYAATASDSSMERQYVKTKKTRKKKKKHHKTSYASGSNASRSASSSDVDDDYDDYDEDDYDEDDDYEEVTVKRIFSSANYRVATDGNLTDIPNLAGRVITDVIPKGLEVDKVEVSVNGSGFHVLGETDYKYDPETRTLTYTVPDDTLSTKVQLRIDTKLSDEIYQEHMLGTVETWQFSNQAKLKGADDGLLAVSKTVTEAVTLGKTMDKEGGTLSPDDRKKIDWTLNVNSDPAGFNQLYVVDYIGNAGATHNYFEGMKLEITGEGISDIMETQWIATPAEAAPYTYAEMGGITDVTEILTGAGIDIDKNQNAIIYTYETEAGTTDAIMLIPVKKYAGKKITIAYQTEVSDAVETDSGNGSVEVKNEAKILWNWLAGPGPHGDYGGATVDKGGLIKYNLVTKAGERVDGDDGFDHARWTFRLNESGVKNLKYLNISDTFTDKNLELTGLVDPLILSAAGKNDIKVRRDDTAGITDVGAETGNFYTIKQNTPEVGSTTFFLHLKGDDDDNTADFQDYTFTLDSVVKGAGFDSASNTYTVTNTATVTGMVGDKPLDFTTSGSCDVTNTLIKKSALPFENGSNEYYYDYDKNIVKWGIEINPKGWTIKAPVIADELPDGLRFDIGNGDCKIVSAKYGEKEATNIAKKDDNSSYVLTLTDGIQVLVTEETNSTTGYSMKFEFLNADGSASATITQPFKVEFTTYLDDGYRKELKSYETTSLLNTATLTGTLQQKNRTETKIEASDTATNAYVPKPVVKTGVYPVREPYDVENGIVPSDADKENFPEVDRIDWVLYVNRTKADMSGAVIEDQIVECLELIPASMKAYSVVLDAEGKETGPPQSLSLDTFEKPETEYDHFKYTIPSELKDTTLKFTFTTILVDDAAASDLKNEATVKKGGFTDHNGDSTVDGARAFRLDSYATAKRLYFARIFKTSTNGTNRFPLKDAEFTIKEMEYKSGAKTDLSSYQEKTGAAVKKRKSNTRGKLNFMFLKADTMYKIVETEAPSLYEKPYYDWYIVPQMTTTNENNWPANMENAPEKPAAENASRPGWVQINTSGKNYHALTFKNDVDPVISSQAKLSFTKLGYNGKTLENIWFEISGAKLEPHRVSSDKNGVVTFENLEPLDSAEVYYTIREIKAPKDETDGSTGYVKTKGKLNGRVYYDAVTGKVVSELERGTLGKDAFSEVDGAVSITNTPIKANASFKKVDQNGEPLKDIEFTVKRFGGSTADNMEMVLDTASTTDSTKYQPYKPKGSSDQGVTVKSGADGVVLLKDLLYGDYLLEETLPETAVDQKTSVTLRIRVKEQGKATLYDGTAWKDISGTDGSKHNLENEIQYGFIQVQKILGKPDEQGKLIPVTNDGKNIPLANIEFNIYRDANSDGNYDQETDPLFMTLKTNASGEFEVNDDGQYTTTTSGQVKVLTVGKYFLKEAESGAVNSQYVTDPKAYPFEIEKWSNSSEKPKKDKPTYISSSRAKNGTADLDGYFLNEAKRGAVTLNKIDPQASEDKKTKTLTGAEFEVFTGSEYEKGNYVADLQYSDVNKAYVLTNPKENSTAGSKASTRSDSFNRPYLEKAVTSGTTTSETLKLLYGEYCVKEIKSPDETLYDAEKAPVFNLKIDADTVTEVSNTDTKNLENTIITNSFTVQKYLEVRKAADDGSLSTEFDHFEVGKGFTFTLEAEKGQGPLNGAAFDPQIVNTNEAEGIAEFNNIPVGTYTLSETGVPTELGTSESPYVDMMQPVIVTVTKENITYRYDGAETNNTSVPTESSAADGTTPAVTYSGKNLIVRNKRRLGSAAGSKVGITGITGADDSNRSEVALAGAKFDLTGTGIDGTMEVTTNNSGEFTISSLPYGTYTLTETEAPNGYKLMDPIQNITVDSGDSVTIQTSENSNGKIEDKLFLKTIKFLKTDQNGDPVKAGNGTKVGFNIERLTKESSVPVPGDYDVAELNGKTDSLTDGYITNDADGYVTIENLAYGVYRVTEVKKSGAMIDYPENEAEMSSFTITVEADQGDASQTKITLHSEAGNRSKSISKKNDDDNTYDFTSGTDLFAVANDLKHGLVNIKKTAADNDGNNSDLGVNTLSPKADKPLSGVIFAVYEDTDGNTAILSDTEKEADPFLTMVTGEDGGFVMNAGGEYLLPGTGPKEREAPVYQTARLVFGHTYWLHEKSLPADKEDAYLADGGYYPFTIEADNTAPGTVIYIGTDKEDGVRPGNTEDIKAHNLPAASTEKVLFPNGPSVRGTVSLTKTDPETAVGEQEARTVTGAEFDIYVNGGSDSPVGKLRDKNDGVYTLLPGSKADGYTPVNESGQAYVKKHEDDYRLLGGSYYVKETKAPSGYVLPADTLSEYWYFTISSDGQSIKNADLKGSDGSSKEKNFTNTLWRREITVVKQVEQFTKDTWREPTAADGIFTFHLVGTPSNLMPKINKTATVEVSGANAGKAVFKDIPSGRYVLTEELTGTLPDGRNMADVYVQPEPIEVVVDENGVSYDGKSAANTADAADTVVTVRNRLKRGSIAGKKMTEDAGGKFALAGAVFELAPVNPAFGESGVRTAKSKADGSIEFKDLPLGTYKLSETEAPRNYETDDTVYTVDVLEESVTVRQGSDGSGSDGSGSDGSGSQTDIEFIDQAVSSITLEKTAEMLSATDLSGTAGPGEGFEFRISGASFEKTDITELMENGRIQVTGASLVEARSDGKDGPGLYVVTDASGKVTVSGLPVGEYQVTEVENEKNGADGIYVRDTEIRAANVEINHGTGKVSEPAVAVHNRLKRSEIQGLKTRTDGTTALSGAVIGLFPADAAEYTEATLFREQKVTTGEDGVFRFTDIPYGEYQIRELSAPSGYYLNDTTVLKVKVTEDGKVITRGETSEGEAALLIKNNKRSSGGGGGGGGGNPGSPDPSKPGVGPGAPTDPANPEDPANPVNPENPENPEETLPGETTEPLPTIPVEPDEEGGTVVIVPPDTPPGTDVVVTDRDHHTVYEGKTESDGNVHVQLPPGEYILVTIADDGVPLAQMTFIIPDDEIPLAKAPDAGDHAVPIALLVVVLLGALTGAGIVLKKRSELEEEE